MRSFLLFFARFRQKEKRGQDYVGITSLPAEGRGTE